MPEIKLSKRLSAIAALIPPSGGVADVGTDHGYIPVWLLQNGYKGAIIATDINSGPLERAKRTAAEYRLREKINFHLCDGLADADEKYISTIVIAGMGGETIAAILNAAPWTREKILILQPMTKSERLRSWLFQNQYRVTAETLVEDGTVYEILCATGGSDIPYEEGEFITGHFPLISGDPLFPQRLASLIEKHRRALAGLQRASDTESALRREALERELHGLLEMQGKLT